MEKAKQQRAQRWRDQLQKALTDEDHASLEDLWKAGCGECLWMALGYQHLDDFCRVELKREVEAVIGTFRTSDLNSPESD